MTIKWENITAEDYKLINDIVYSLRKITKEQRNQFHTSISAVHATRPLDLQKLYDLDAFCKSNDVLGMDRFVDRQTGILTNGFIPKCGFRKIQET